MKKKGMSEVVTTLIIILLSIVAIGVVWVVVRNIIDKGQDDITLDAFGLDLQIEKASSVGDILSVTVKRNAGGGDLAGINFVIGDGDNSVVVRWDTNLVPLGRETFEFKLSDLAIGTITEISVAPIYLTDSGKEVTGEILDTQTYGGSSGGGSVGSGGGSSGGGGGGSGPVCGDGTCQSGETVSCPADCTAGGPVCGDGSTESPETCDDGNTVPGDGCSATCQTEGGGTCNNDGTCDIPFEDSVNCLADCPIPAPSCDGVWDTQDVTDNNECDGGGTPGGVLHCLSNCVCEVGFGPDSNGNCVLDLPIDSGDIFAVWPVAGDATRFSSPDLPTSQIELQDFTSYYINFRGGSLETRCFRIQSASYYEDILSSEVELLINFLVEDLADIGPAQIYDIWEANNCGQ